jgi:hypothetical protein
MANLAGVSPNRIVADAERSASMKKRLVAIVGVVMAAAAALAVHPLLGVPFLAATVVGWFLTTQDPALLAGAKGELLALEELAKLPDTYHLFNQLDIPNERSRTVVNEADLVVAGPNAIFVIEVKHNNGRVRGSAGDRDWAVQKTGRAGGQYAKTMRNPIAQVKQLVWLLSKQLEARGKRRPWIQGVVLFSNVAVELEVGDSEGIPCLRLDQLRDYLLSFPEKGASGAQALPKLAAIKAKAA